MRASKSIQLLSLNNSYGVSHEAPDPACYGRAGILYENKRLDEERQLKSFRQSLRELEDGLSLASMSKQ